jgi:hypothetical protein
VNLLIVLRFCGQGYFLGGEFEPRPEGWGTLQGISNRCATLRLGRKGDAGGWQMKMEIWEVGQLAVDRWVLRRLRLLRMTILSN